MKPAALLFLPLFLFSACRSSNEGLGSGPLRDAAPRRIQITRMGIGTESKVIAEVRGDTPEARKLIDDLWDRHHQSFPASDLRGTGTDPGQATRFTQLLFMHGMGIVTAYSYQKSERNPTPRLAADPEARRR